MKLYCFYFFTIGCIVTSLFMVTMTVQAKEAGKLQHENTLYETLEDRYVQVLRDTLYDRGYSNAGITMTKVYLEDGKREYTVKIHHRRIDKMDETDRQDLLTELSVIPFADAECKVNLNFL